MTAMHSAVMGTRQPPLVMTRVTAQVKRSPARKTHTVMMMMKMIMVKVGKAKAALAQAVMIKVVIAKATMTRE